MKYKHAFVLALAVVAGLGIGTSLSWSQTRPSASTQRTSEAVAHYQKAYDLYQQGNLIDAQRENNEALRLDPQFQEALILRDIVNSQIPAQSGRPNASTRPTQLPVAMGELLNQKQISRIRMYELTTTELRDSRSLINGKIPLQTLEQFWDRVVLADPRQGATSKEDHDNFVRGDRFRYQVAMIKEYKADQYYSDVVLFSDPAVMIEFRNRVQPYLLQNCATAKCHGSPDPKSNHGYRIYGSTTQRPIDAEVYTNFFILSTKKVGQEQLLNRDEPERSLLLQYGLPKKDALIPHPGNVNVSKFRSQQDPLFRDIVAWARTLAFPISNYGIDFKPASATQPTTKDKP